MTTFINPGSGGGRGELRFRLGDIPVTVQPLFWLTMLIMCGNRDAGSAMIWIAVCFVSILWHEVGHVLAYRFFGARGSVVLYAWGGLAYSDRAMRRGPMAQVIVSMAGPLAGFGLAAVTIAVAMWAGATVQAGFALFVIPRVDAFIMPHGPDLEISARALRYWNVLLSDLLWINIYWGIVNLLPIYPLDGGQAARAIFVARDPLRGARRALLLSAIVAAGVALLGLAEQNYYLVVMFGLLAASSAQAMEHERATQ